MYELGLDSNECFDAKRKENLIKIKFMADAKEV